ncbi:MAG: hypothetical protein M1825_001701 [Sarcosagium campestre]|nr:MAG: hypothetical protein M1825_001701 [Sarcosagium campestre]
MAEMNGVQGNSLGALSNGSSNDIIVEIAVDIDDKRMVWRLSKAMLCLHSTFFREALATIGAGEPPLEMEDEAVEEMACIFEWMQAGRCLQLIGIGTDAHEDLWLVGGRLGMPGFQNFITCRLWQMYIWAETVTPARVHEIYTICEPNCQLRRTLAYAMALRNNLMDVQTPEWTLVFAQYPELGQNVLTALSDIQNRPDGLPLMPPGSPVQDEVDYSIYPPHKDR